MTVPANLDTCTVALSSREDGDGRKWVHLLPAGTFHSSRDGRGPWHADNPAAIMSASQQVAGRREIPIDYDHQIDHAPTNGQPAPAAGWIKGLQARADGIWGHVEWTGRAAAHLAAREYRYLSPVIRHAPDGRVVAILRAALTNNPALDQLTALASKETLMAFTPTDELADLRQTLNLGPDADMAAILTAVRELSTQRMSAQAPDPSKYVPIGEFVRVTQELNRVHNGIELQAAQLHVEEQVRAGKLLPFMRDWGISLCTANKPAFDQFISQAGTMLARSIGPSGASTLPPSFGGRAGALADTDAHVASVLGLTTEQFSDAAGK